MYQKKWTRNTFRVRCCEFWFGTLFVDETHRSAQGISASPENAKHKVSFRKPNASPMSAMGPKISSQFSLLFRITPDDTHKSLIRSRKKPTIPPFEFPLCRALSSPIISSSNRFESSWWPSVLLLPFIILLALSLAVFLGRNKDELNELPAPEDQHWISVPGTVRYAALFLCPGES